MNPNHIAQELVDNGLIARGRELYEDGDSPEAPVFIERENDPMFVEADDSWMSDGYESDWDDYDDLPPEGWIPACDEGYFFETPFADLSS